MIGTLQALEAIKIAVGIKCILHDCMHAILNDEQVSFHRTFHSSTVTDKNID